MRILFVCTGNLCRSPLAERFTVAELGDKTDRLTVESAGLAASNGVPMHPAAQRELVRLGGDPDGFAARVFSPEMAESADLVLTMTRNQRAEILRIAPRGLRKTFTLLEAADLAGQLDMHGLEHLRPPLPARVLALRLDAGRRSRRSSSADDILDPVGRPARVHAEVADRIATAMRALMPFLLLHTGSAKLPAHDSRGVCSV